MGKRMINQVISVAMAAAMVFSGSPVNVIAKEQQVELEQTTTSWKDLYLVGQIGNGKSIQLNSFVEVLILLCVYTIVFDHFFCGYACAFGATSDFLYAFGQWLLKKMKKKKKHQLDALDILQYVKYIILATIIENCPKENIATGKNKEELKGNEVWFILFRAGILFGMLGFFV